MSDKNLSGKDLLAWIAAVSASVFSLAIARFVATGLVLDAFGVDHVWLTPGRAIAASVFVSMFVGSLGSDKDAVTSSGSLRAGGALRWCVGRHVTHWLPVAIIYIVVSFI